MAYASKYYDPVKAHEYYMKHRQLKGRRKRASTYADGKPRYASSLNQQGKEALAYIREQLKKERDAKKTQLKEQRTRERERLKNQLKRITDLLRGFVKGAPSKEMKDYLRGIIKRVRENFSAKRKAVTEKYRALNKKASADYKAAYAAEFDKLAADPAFQKGKKRKKR